MVIQLVELCPSYCFLDVGDTNLVALSFHPRSSSPPPTPAYNKDLNKHTHGYKTTLKSLIQHKSLLQRIAQGKFSDEKMEGAKKYADKSPEGHLITISPALCNAGIPP